MKWWCSASATPWEWIWRPYPGVWLLIAVVLWRYVRLRRADARAGAAGGERNAEPGAANGWNTVAFALGLATLWAALDWPLGPLGAGYLVSVHTVQYLLLNFVAAPLLLLGVPPASWRRLARSGAIGAVLRFAVRPLVALIGYDVIIVVTHVPSLVDGLMAQQLGNMVIDLAWLASGLLLWWPVVAPDDVSRLAPLLKMGYLFATTIIPTAPAAFLTFSDYPAYSIFELAPRVYGIGALQDQQTAGILMKLAADPFIWLAMGIVFFRWSGEAEREEEARRLAVSRPASTRV
ncbi:MAG TPA: cytochrome c oxidase assembly protein [Gemmatimonadales bacterium]|nr:cytochrome c oxidase assembly protein [Gemmatimonadales bacterium]